VEADSRQLDINQPFALFLPGEAALLHRGADFFQLAVNVIYTRTLRDPLWGLKLSGKEGASTVAAIRQGRPDQPDLSGSQESRSLPWTSALRPGPALQARSREQYTLGALLTSRSGEDYFNRVYGVDGEAASPTSTRSLSSSWAPPPAIRTRSAASFPSRRAR